MPVKELTNEELAAVSEAVDKQPTSAQTSMLVANLAREYINLREHHIEETKMLISEIKYLAETGHQAYHQEVVGTFLTCHKLSCSSAATILKKVKSA